jgi:hypothetical protein
MTTNVQASHVAPLKQRRVIAGRVRVTLMKGTEARGDTDLLNFSCGAGVHTPEGERAVREVQQGVKGAYEGQSFQNRVVKVSEDGGGLIGVAVICMTGDHSNRRLTREPYIGAIGRHDDYYRSVMSDNKTSVGAIVLRAAVDAVALEYEKRPMPEIWARVLVSNTSSQQIFTELGFDRLPKDAFNPPTEQVIRVRRADKPLPPELTTEMYLPPEPPPPMRGRNDPCWCDSGKKYKKCHGF